MVIPEPPYTNAATALFFSMMKDAILFRLDLFNDLKTYRVFLEISRQQRTQNFPVNIQSVAAALQSDEALVVRHVKKLREMGFLAFSENLAVNHVPLGFLATVENAANLLNCIYEDRNMQPVKLAVKLPLPELFSKEMTDYVSYMHAYFSAPMGDADVWREGLEGSNRDVLIRCQLAIDYYNEDQPLDIEDFCNRAGVSPARARRDLARVAKVWSFEIENEAIVFINNERMEQLKKISWDRLHHYLTVAKGIAEIA